ncbi:helix-turn-helix domain-containing protein [Bradyrhizobium liaoningense]|uniref:helix-turn-helix transcriptional regulator n=1 Tax=Bradyrhizobium liaoningense TaxID=43992 RepID=UPI001BAA84BC|nr:helix-turn-helix domain-containing protein [Bradyrhizobium liaoningense]MBR0842933.1 helix-turn-helix domain-containing protein [Bradyrhizobium liaoningense]
MITEEYLRAAEAAAYLKSSTSTLAKLRVYGGGPLYTRIGRAVRYKKSDLDAYMSRNTCSSTTKEQAND